MRPGNYGGVAAAPNTLSVDGACAVDGVVGEVVHRGRPGQQKRGDAGYSVQDDGGVQPFCALPFLLQMSIPLTDGSSGQQSQWDSPEVTLEAFRRCMS